MSFSLGQPLDGAPLSDLRFGLLGGPDGLDGEGHPGTLAEGRLDGASALDGASFHSLDESAAPGVRVLIVDDHADMVGLMRMMMERRCYRVATALSGEQALEVAPEFGPHVVISDIGMPGMDGYEMMLALRSMNARAPFKSIALSGYDATQEEPRARAAGFDAQLTKPIDFDSLFQTIDALAPKPD